jgi:hypothetical protein
MLSLSRFLLAALLAASLAGCAGSDDIAEVEERWAEGNFQDHLRPLTEPIVPPASSRVARRTLYAARRLEAAGLMPARAPSFLVRMRGTALPVPPASIDPTQAHVLGYIAGRHPSHYDDLVLVAADLNSVSAAAVLEVARALAEEARFTQTPERTVLFALWSPPRTGPRGLADFLSNPTWALPNVERALLVTSDSSAAAESRELLAVRGIPSDVVTVEDQNVTVQETSQDVLEARTLTRTVLLADFLYARVLAAATVRDSVAASP